MQRYKVQTFSGENMILNIKDGRVYDEKMTEINWWFVSYFIYLSEEFMEKYSMFLDWTAVSYMQPMTEKFMEKYKNRINYNVLFSRHDISETFIENNKHLLNWTIISRYQSPLSNEFLLKHQDLICWKTASRFVDFTEKQIEMYKHKFDWENITKYAYFSDDFLLKFITEKDLNKYRSSPLENYTEHPLVYKIIIDNIQKNTFMTVKEIESNSFYFLSKTKLNIGSSSVCQKILDKIINMFF